MRELILVMGADCRNPETGLAGRVFCNYSSPTPSFVLCIFPSLGRFHRPVPRDNQKAGAVTISFPHGAWLSLCEAAEQARGSYRRHLP